MSDDRVLLELGKAKRERDQQRDMREGAAADDLSLPLSQAEQHEILGRLLPAPPVRMQSRRRWIIVGAAAFAAGTAALIALVNNPGGQPALPAYGLRVSSEVYTGLRGGTATEEPIFLQKGMRLEFVLEPQSRAASEVAARTFFVAANERREIHRKEIDRSGAVKISLVAGLDFELPSPYGELVFVVGWPAAVSRWNGNAEDGDEDVQVLTCGVRAEGGA